MMRMIAFLLFGLGIAAAIVGGAKLPDKQVKYIEKRKPFDAKMAEAQEALREFTKELKDAGKSIVDDKKKQKKGKRLTGGEKEKLASLEEGVDDARAAIKAIKGWPPKKYSDRFSNATPVFCIGVGIAIAGVVLWRHDIRERRAADRAETENAASDSGTADATGTPAQYIKSVQPAMSDLELLKDASSPDFLNGVDGVLDDHVTPFVEMRHQLVEDLGLSRAAPIMLHMARGERLLNRAWSAEADGFRDEAVDALSEACEVFQEALDTFDGKDE